MGLLKRVVLSFLLFGFAQAYSTKADDSLHQEILQLGCETIGVDGYCSQDTYDTEMPFSELIEQSRMEVVYDHNRLTMSLKWDKAIENVRGLASEAFLEKLLALRKLGKVQSIVEFHPYPEFCPADEENCEYAYFFLYLKDGTSFFFHWVK